MSKKIAIYLLVLSFYCFGGISDMSWWQQRYCPVVLDSGAIDLSIEMLRAHLLNLQSVRGDFGYEMQISDGIISSRQNQSSQSQALIALSELLSSRPTEQTRRAFFVAVDFFIRNRRPAGNDCILVASLPDIEVVKTDAVADFALALAHYVQKSGVQLPESIRNRFLEFLEEELRYFQMMKLESGGWCAEYDFMREYSLPATTPESDAKVLQFYCRMQSQFGHNELSETIEIELERQCRDNIMDYLEHGGDPAVMRSSFCAMTWMLDEYLGMAECQHRDIAEEALSGLSWWVIYGDHRAITEAVSLRTSLGLIPAAKMFDAKKMPTEYGVILDFIKTLTGEALHRQVAGQYWIPSGQTIVSENCAGGVLSYANAKNAKLVENARLLRILLYLIGK